MHKPKWYHGYSDVIWFVVIGSHWPMRMEEIKYNVSSFIPISFVENGKNNKNRPASLCGWQWDSVNWSYAPMTQPNDEAESVFLHKQPFSLKARQAWVATAGGVTAAATAALTVMVSGGNEGGQALSQNQPGGYFAGSVAEAEVAWYCTAMWLVLWLGKTSAKSGWTCIVLGCVWSHSKVDKFDGLRNGCFFTVSLMTPHVLWGKGYAWNLHWNRMGHKSQRSNLVLTWCVLCLKSSVWAAAGAGSVQWHIGIGLWSASMVVNSLWK